MTSAFQIISTLRYDPALPDVLSYPDSLRTPYYLLPFHQDRLLRAAQCFEWQAAIDFLEKDADQFLQFLDSFIPDKTKAWRLRIVIDQHGVGTVEANPTPTLDLSGLLIPSETHSSSSSAPWRVYIDTKPTKPSKFTTHKTTAREDYTSARLRSGIHSPQEQAEVLVVNPEGEIMEGSITTPYFRRRNHVRTDQATGPDWITPPLSSGGNAGTTRRYALAQGFCTEQVIRAADLVDGEECWLSNGVRGFIRGRVVLNGTIHREE
ncbi:Aminodeoxychorismate lyase [Aspergillus melleus]|uniref:Aminodeoxychorismate lyase n=1 Tax=Aspergillus melleus TaxID=138277 RepID=A0ACC3B2X3_9EURO|nr:Aminodeoxychorismate lyase [Aspergillus melleus]